MEAEEAESERERSRPRYVCDGRTERRQEMEPGEAGIMRSEHCGTDRRRGRAGEAGGRSRKNQGSSSEAKKVILDKLVSLVKRDGDSMSGRRARASGTRRIAYSYVIPSVVVVV